MKKWLIGKPDENSVREIMSAAGICRLSAEVLASRGINGKEDTESFFGISEATDELRLFDPFELPDMQKAADIIADAADSGKKICIYGDYDCDGILSTAALYNYLSETGADVEYFINKRSDGYGMNIDNVRMLAEKGIQLIITVDNGISALNEAALCRELGVQLVITDHHEPPPQLPDADAIVDPHINNPDNTAHFRDLCGCCVVLKLITAMEYGESAIPVEMMSDFAAVAAIGDVMPLRGENRTIVRHGLHYLQNTENPGMQALIAAVSGSKGFSYDARTVAFSIVPRINAAGRMGSAMDAAELFTTEDPERAAELAAHLCELNDSRKKAEDSVLEDAESFFNENPGFFNAHVILVYGSGWHPGVIGIAASKICEQTGKPVFIISFNEDNIGVGSARAPKGYSIFNALLECSDLMIKFGGHEGAGGFSIARDNLDEFYKRICSIAGDSYFEPQIQAVKPLTPEEATVETAEQLRRELMPFGEKNPEPVFLLSDCKILRTDPLSGGKYTRVTVNFSGSEIAFPMFRTQFSDFPFAAGETVNIAAALRINEYNGKKTLTLYPEDIRASGVNQQKLLGGERIYRGIKFGNFPEDKNVLKAMLPSRNEYAAVYTALPPEREISEDYIFNKFCGRINSCMLNIILDCFWQTGLISRSLIKRTVCRLKTEQGKKADFNSAEIIRSINEKI